MWWRFKSFWEPFWRFLVWGNSTWGKATKVIGLLLFIGGSSIASFWESPGYLILHAFNREIISTPFRFSVLMAIILALFWIFICIGRAYELAGIPDLIVGEDLVIDGENFRLELESKQKDFDTTVTLIEILDEKKSRVLPGRFPLELEWSHHPGESKVYLKAGIRGSVSVAMMHPRSLGDYMLQFTGAQHLGTLTLKAGDKVYFHLHIEHRRHKPIERWFCFEKVDNCTFSADLIDPATLTQQASLSSSR